MPFTLALTYQPRLHVAATRRLSTVVRAALPAFAALWLGLLRDLRTWLTRRRLHAALQTSGLFGAQALLDQAWQQTVDAPGRAALGLLATQLLEDAGTTMEPEAQRLTGQHVAWIPGLPETEYWVRGYVGAQMLLIRTTTLTTARQTMYAAWQASVGMAAVTRVTTAVLGLTRQHAGTVQRMDERLAADGATAVTRQQASARAIRLLLRRRAQTIAETETHTLGQEGQRQLMLQAIRSGVVVEEQVRRYWEVSEDEHLCARCAPIPGLNPDGVALDAPFHTPEGPVMGPTLHPLCRCEVTYAVQA